MTAKSNPATGAFTITPSDVTEFAPATRALLVGTGGTIYVDMEDEGTNVPLVVPAGYNPIAVTRVYSTGLVDAADITGLR